MKQRKTDLKNVPDIDLDIREIIEKYYDTVKSTALYVTRSEDIASDITQDVFTTLVEKWDHINRKYTGAWILGVTRNKLFEYFRQNNKNSAVIPLEDTAITDDNALSSYDSYFELSDEQLNSLKEKVLSVLSENERRIYEAYFVEKHTYDEICALYSMSYSAATSRIKRIRRKLERSIKENGPDTLGLLAVSTAALTYVAQLIFNGR